MTVAAVMMMNRWTTSAVTMHAVMSMR